LEALPKQGRRHTARGWRLKRYAPKCAPKWLERITPDSTGFGRIPLDSLEKHEMFPLKAREIRAIPTLAYERCSEFSEQMRHPLLAARTFEWEK
jgi:hypothetical protein